LAKEGSVIVLFKIIISRLYSIFAPFFLSDDKRYRYYKIGKYTYGRPTIMQWGEGASLKIGKYCSIASNVIIMLGGEHRFHWISAYPFNKIFKENAHLVGHPYSKGNIVIGNDVWIGTGAIILSGVEIGNGAIIGAGSVVRKRVPSYSVTAGNPAEVLLYRFNKETINKLEEIAWWDWPESKVKEMASILMSDKISSFMDMHLKKSE
jgi:virginiamycin A acetyltransferase